MATKHRRGSLTAARAQIKDRIVNMGQKGPFIVGYWTHGGMNDYEVRPATKPWIDNGYSVNGINLWYVQEIWHGISGRGARMRAEKIWDRTKARAVKKNPMHDLNMVKAIGDYSVRLDGTEITIYARGGKRLARRYYSTEGLASRSYKNLTSMTKINRFIDANS